MKALMVVAGLLLGMYGATAEGQSYLVQDLGTLGGSSSAAYGINEAGQIVGTAENASGVSLPVLYSGGAIQALGTEAGVARAINDSGLVVGSNSSGAFFSISGSIAGIAGFSSAVAVNNHGQIVVTAGSGPLGGAGVSAIYADGVTGPNLPLVGESINDSGTVGGHFFSVNRDRAATYTSAGVFTDYSLIFPGPTGFVRAINTSGQLAVRSVGGSLSHIYRYSAGAFVEIGDPFSPIYKDVHGLNDAGVAVGTVQVAVGSLFFDHAWVSDGLSMKDLNDQIPAESGWLLNSAYGINNSGLIVGTGTIGGQRRAFLLTPVPEPSPLASGLMLLIAWGSMRRWHRRGTFPGPGRVRGWESTF